MICNYNLTNARKPSLLIYLALEPITCLETVYSDGIIPIELNRCPMAVHLHVCSDPTQNNVSTDLAVPSVARVYTTYKSYTASLLRIVSAVTVWLKSMYEDVHASTGHPEYTGMQWHQQHTLGANYIDKDAASARGISAKGAL